MGAFLAIAPLPQKTLVGDLPPPILSDLQQWGYRLESPLV